MDASHDSAGRDQPSTPARETNTSARMVGEIVRAAGLKVGGRRGLVVAVAPMAVFAVINAVSTLPVAVGCAAATGVVVFAYRMIRGERVGGALAGLVLVVVCASVAAFTGEARGFFLLPTALPAVVVLICAGSLIIRRPLTGLLLNRVAGGPTSWRSSRPLLRIYSVTTLAAIGINIVNFVVQTVFYLADAPAVLAVAHAATGPVFAALVAGTLIAVRRQISREPSGSATITTATRPGMAERPRSS